MAPTVLFVHNRPWHTLQTVEVIQRCELETESNLYIFVDDSKADASEMQKTKISKVRKFIHTIDGFHSVTIEEPEVNKGSANSVISGVTKVIERYGKVIVGEYDIVAHPFLLHLMNDALDTYHTNSKIFVISTTMERMSIPQKYKKDIFLTSHFGSWGWATWSDSWNFIDCNILRNKVIEHPTQKSTKHFCKGGTDLLTMLETQHRGDIDL